MLIDPLGHMLRETGVVVVQRMFGVLLPEEDASVLRGNLQSTAPTETLDIMRALLVLLAGACLGAKNHNKEIKLSKDSSLNSWEPVLLHEFWEGDLGGPHLPQSGVPQAF